MSRYASLAASAGAVHAVWFSPLGGNREIFHTVLRKK
jgi:hypothetical protein